MQMTRHLARCWHRFILAEESPFFEAKFRSPEFAKADGSIDLTELDGATLQVCSCHMCLLMSGFHCHGIALHSR